jgi:alkanesulfonate monooxygenase SsuD/methylene tetrahydromethanopterin reductase-like flavin-dependent oxidoreductase (luciferase family)
MFTEERATVRGRYHRVNGALNFPRPIQPGGPKILIGGSGERRILRLVAQYGDACNLFGDAGTVRRKLAVLQDHCREVGRDPADITKTRMGTLVIGRTKEEADSRMEQLLQTWARTGMDHDQLQAHVTVGDLDAVCGQVQAFFDAGLDGLIFHMPVGTSPEDVALAGRALTDRFGLT